MTVTQISEVGHFTIHECLCNHRQSAAPLVILDFNKTLTPPRCFGSCRNLLWGVLLLAAFAWGQEPVSEKIQVSQTPSVLPKGLAFEVSSEFSYDPNVLRQQKDLIGSRLWVVSPTVRYSRQASGGLYSLSYNVSRSEFVDSQQDSSTAHTLVMAVDQKINAYNKVSISGSYNYAFEGRGVGFNEGDNAGKLDSPTPMITKQVEGKYRLGADKAKMRFTGSIGRRSSDRNSQSIVNDSRDYHEDLLGAELDYRVGGRTDLVVEWRDRVISYNRTPLSQDGTEIPLDSVEQQYLVGLDLEATSKTTGKLRVGTTQRDFKWKAAQWADAKAASGTTVPAVAAAATNFPVDSGAELYWELSAVWAPRPFSKFELSSRTSTHEALGVGSFVRGMDYALSWSHQWRSRLRSRLEFSLGTDSYKDSSRVDKRKAYGARMEYDFDTRMSFGLGYRYQEMASTAKTTGFDKSMYYIFANYRSK